MLIFLCKYVWSVNITLTNTPEEQVTHKEILHSLSTKCFRVLLPYGVALNDSRLVQQTNIDSVASCVFSESRGSVRSRHRDGRRGVRGQPGVSRGLSHQLRLQSQEAARLTTPRLDLGRLRRQHRVRLQVRLALFIRPGSPGGRGYRLCDRLAAMRRWLSVAGEMALEMHKSTATCVDMLCVSGSRETAAKHQLCFLARLSLCANFI